MVDIERSIFHALGHNRPGKLLPAHDKSQASFALSRKNVRKILQQQHFLNEIKASRTYPRRPLTSLNQSLVYVIRRRLRKLHAADVGTINGEARRNFGKSFN